MQKLEQMMLIYKVYIYHPGKEETRMKEIIGRLREFVDDLKIGIRFYRLGRRYSRRNIQGITTKSLRDIYGKA